MCPEVIPECPVCPASQECVVSNPSDCTECPKAYCADAAADATPTPTGILGGTTSSTSDGGFTLPTVSESQTSTGTGSPSLTDTDTITATESVSLLPTTDSTIGTGGASNSATATASAPAASSSAASSVGGRNADVAGMLGVALLIAVPVLGLQRLW